MPPPRLTGSVPIEETLAHLSRKAGLPSDAWREGASFQVFEGQVFNEPR